MQPSGNNNLLNQSIGKMNSWASEEMKMEDFIRFAEKGFFGRILMVIECFWSKGFITVEKSLKHIEIQENKDELLAVIPQKIRVSLIKTSKVAANLFNNMNPYGNGSKPLPTPPNRNYQKNPPSSGLPVSPNGNASKQAQQASEQQRKLEQERMEREKTKAVEIKFSGALTSWAKEIAKLEEQVNSKENLSSLLKSKERLAETLNEFERASDFPQKLVEQREGLKGYLKTVNIKIEQYTNQVKDQELRLQEKKRSLDLIESDVNTFVSEVKKLELGEPQNIALIELLISRIAKKLDGFPNSEFIEISKQHIHIGSIFNISKDKFFAKKQQLEEARIQKEQQNKQEEARELQRREKIANEQEAQKQAELVTSSKHPNKLNELSETSVEENLEELEVIQNEIDKKLKELED